MISLEVESRTEFGKGAMHKLRRAGYIPAVMYGRHEENLHLKIDSKEFLHKHHPEVTLIDLKVPSGAEEVKGIIREIQRDPVTQKVLHLDFLHIHFGEPIEIDVSFHFVGTPVGTKLGGIFEEHIRTIHIRCLPSNIPEYIEIDVSNLDIGDNIHISDISAENIEILMDPSSVVASVTRLRGEETTTEEEEEEEEEETTEE